MLKVPKVVQDYINSIKHSNVSVVSWEKQHDKYVATLSSGVRVFIKN